MTTTSTTSTVILCESTFVLSRGGEEFGGLDRSGSSGCDSLAAGRTCEVTFNAGSSSDLSACIAAGTYTWFCPEQGTDVMTKELHAMDPYIQCRVCDAGFNDTDHKTGDIGGTVYFGPNMVNGMVDESVLDYYVVLPVDDCGHIPKDATVLGSVAKSSTAAICCEENKYQIQINQPNFAYNKIMVVPAGANYSFDFLEDGVVIDVVDLTTTTTTMTTATVTTTLSTTTSATMSSTMTAVTQTMTITTVATLGDGGTSGTVSAKMAPMALALLAWAMASRR